MRRKKFQKFKNAYNTVLLILTVFISAQNAPRSKGKQSKVTAALKITKTTKCECGIIDILKPLKEFFFRYF